MANVVARRDAAALVEAPVEVDDNLARAVVVHELKLADVAVLHHELQKLDDHLAGWPDEHLALAALLGVVHRLERIVEHGDAHHRGVGCAGARDADNRKGALEVGAARFGEARGRAGRRWCASVGPRLRAPVRQRAAAPAQTSSA